VKPKVLVVYGYHSGETYAFDIGLRLVKEPYRNFVIERYRGKSDKRGTRFESHPDYERNLHSFIGSFSMPYAIVLHNSGDASRYWAYRRKHPGVHFTRMKWPKVEVDYETRRKLPERISQEIRQIGQKYFPDFRVQIEDEFARYPDSMPEGLDELSVEFYVHNRPAKSKAVKLVKDLAEYLSGETEP